MRLHTRVQVPGYQGHLGGEKGADCGTDYGPAVLYWVAWGSSQYNVWHSPQPAKMPCTPCRSGWRRSLEGILLESVEDEPLASPTPHRGGPTAQWGPGAQTAEASVQPEEAPKPDNAVRFEVIMTDPWDIQQQISSLPLRFRPPTLLLGLPPLEDAEPIINLPSFPAWYYLLDLHRDCCSQKYPDGWVWVSLLDMAHLNDVPLSEQDLMD